MHDERLMHLVHRYLDAVTRRRMRELAEAAEAAEADDEVNVEVHIYAQQQPTPPQTHQQRLTGPRSPAPQQPQTNGQLPPAPPHRKPRRNALPQPPQHYQDPNGGGQQ